MTTPDRIGDDAGPPDNENSAGATAVPSSASSSNVPAAAIMSSAAPQLQPPPDVPAPQPFPRLVPDPVPELPPPEGVPAVGAVAEGLVTGAAITAAVGSVALAGATVYAAAKGEKTPIEVADDYYGTHFGDIWGWMKGDYSNEAGQKQQQLRQATNDAATCLDNSSPQSVVAPCHATAQQQQPSVASPVSKTPVMPQGLSAQDEELWKECENMHEEYKRTQEESGSQSARIKKVLDDLANNRPVSPQQKLDLCNWLGELIKTLERLHRQREKYIDSGCDKFDWFASGGTETDRKQSHQDELDAVDRQIKNAYKARQKYCEP